MVRRSGASTSTSASTSTASAMMMLVTVTRISLLVHVYSLEYLRGDRRYVHYFAALSLFTASMLALVLADNMLMLLIAWELVGLCSFMLIGHWWEDKANSDAGLKAFITNRVGDIGLIVGISILFCEAGTFNIQRDQRARAHAAACRTPCARRARCACSRRGVQERPVPAAHLAARRDGGPTPVSALIHAATMVVAGVYMVARVYGVFWRASSIDAGGHQHAWRSSAASRSSSAPASRSSGHDIKKVLAYSTISQLGYMVVALGVGAWTAASSTCSPTPSSRPPLPRRRSVSHAGPPHLRHDEEDGRPAQAHAGHLRDLRRRHAGAGRHLPLAGFWSKDEILARRQRGRLHGILVLGLIGALHDRRLHEPRASTLRSSASTGATGTPHESPRL